MNELQQNVPAGGIVIAMCATKCDLASDQDTSQAEALAAKTGSMFFTTSAKTNTNVNLLFQKVTERVLGAADDMTNPNSSTVQHPSQGPLSPSMRNGLSNESNFHSRIPTTPLATVQEKGRGAVRSPMDGKRQRPDDDNVVLDPAKTSPSGESSTSKEGVNVSRCDPHSMLMCGDVVGAAENGGGCTIQ
jgi:hypothetical protein